MEHEHVSTPERNLERSAGAFNLEKLTPDQVVGLVSTLSAGLDLDGKAQRRARETLGILEQDLAVLAEQAPDKAEEFFSALISGDEDPGTRSLGIGMLTVPLLKEYAHDDNKRQ